MYSINIRYSTQNPQIFPVGHSVSISSKFTFRQHLINRSGTDKFEKQFQHFFSCDFTIFRGEGNKNYIVLIIFSRLSTQILIEYLRFIISYGKANKKRISWHSGTSLNISCLLESQYETFSTWTRQFLKFQNSVL